MARYMVPRMSSVMLHDLFLINPADTSGIAPNNSVGSTFIPLPYTPNRGRMNQYRLLMVRNNAMVITQLSVLYTTGGTSGGLDGLNISDPAGPRYFAVPKARIGKKMKLRKKSPTVKPSFLPKLFESRFSIHIAKMTFTNGIRKSNIHHQGFPMI